MKTQKMDWKSIRPFLKLALQENGAWNDRTSKSRDLSGRNARGEVLAKGAGVLAGLPLNR